MPLRQKTKQMRRIQSLKMRMKKYENSPSSINPDVSLQLWEEWQAIVNSTGFSHGFLQWLLSYPEVHVAYERVPTFAELFHIEQILRYELDQITFSITRRTRQHVKFLKQIDIQKYGKRQAFQSIRESSLGLVQQLDSSITVSGKILPETAMGFVSVQIPPDTPIDLTAACKVQGHLCDIVSWQSPVLDLMIHDADVELPQEVQLEQPVQTVKPSEVAKELGNYWNQFWNANTEGQLNNLSEWEAFTTMAEDIPMLPQIPLEMGSLEQWKSAIKSLKPGTSRGVCGWSSEEFKMLTDPMLIDLIAIFQKVAEQGMPNYLMWAKTIPLAKEKGVFSPAKTRPITVLSLLYRLWGKVVSQQVLPAWSRTFPSAITGFLPGRSSQSMLYHLQAKLEQVQFGIESHQWSGLTLDLVKCFNCLPRQPAKYLLQRLGIPAAVVNCWFESIARLDRWWLINNQMYPTGSASTGCPEGDTMSVLTMLAFNYLWTSANITDETILNAFADNWSYATSNSGQHEQIVSYIMQLCNALQIKIDWQKTWAWASGQSHRDILQRVASQLLPQDVRLQLVTHARELGYIMHYRCQQFRGTIKARHHAALGRLKKLQHSDAPMHVKAQIARASCIVKAMFGAETFALGDRYFTTLRTAIAHALLGPKRNIQTYLACMCLSKFLIDPELYVIQMALRKAREYLVYATPEDAQAFFTVLVTSRLPAAQIIGPAASLKWYIGKLGWTINRTGHLQISAFYHLHLCESNFEDILQATEDSWMEIVADSMQTRKHCRNIPPVDHVLTRSVFEKLPEQAKRAVAMQMVGGFMLNNQKRHFDPQQSELCEHCSQPDSLQHRLLECNATDEVRRLYPDVIDFLQEHDVIHQAFPLCFRDPAFEFHRTIQCQLPSPELDLTRLTLNSVVFTDGSCSHPVNPRFRVSSYAAVTAMEDGYATIAVSHCQGRQTIPRAELSAVVLVDSHANVAAIVTDSAYVLQVRQKLQRVTDIRTMHLEKNYDLLKQWWLSIQMKDSSAQVFKVKAHQTLQTSDPELAFLRQGNAMADEAAKIVNKSLLPDYLKSLEQSFTEWTVFKRLMIQQYNMRFEMSMKRVQLLRQQPVRPQADSCGLQWFVQYGVEEPRVFTPPEEAFSHIHASHWGTTFSGLLLDWLATLEWPAAEPSKTTAVGITWFELAINFQVVTQQSIPVSVKMANGTKQHCWQYEDSALDVEQFAYSDLIFSLQGSVKHLQYLLQLDLLPPHKTQKVRSLHLLGGNVFRMGFAARPVMKYQAETMQCVQQYLNRHAAGGLKFQQHPEIPTMLPIVVPRFFPLPEDTQAKRATRYNVRKRDIRLARA